MDTKKLRVLVVEDEGIIARDITSMLEQLGYEVSGQAGTGADALRLASNVPADLVLMDIKIRGNKDGIETAAEIRKLYDIPVVFLTSHADSDTLRRANQTEPFGYVVKPFNEADLKVAIEVGFNRHRLQLEAESKRVWFDSALTSISDAVIATDSDGYIAFFNGGAEQLTGWNRRDALHRRFYEVVQMRDDHGQSNSVDLDMVMASDKPLPFASALVRHKNGTEQAVVGSIGPMRREGSGLIYGAVIILREASELSQAGRALDQRDSFLRRSNKHLQELSYALSHDLREPVRNISCFAQLLERHDAQLLDEEAREYLNFIAEGARRIDSQLTALRQFHQAGNCLVVSTPGTDAKASCLEAWARLEQNASEQGARLDVSALPTVDVPAAALTDIFEHLLSNALRFRSDNAPLIRVTAIRLEDYWQFTVEDNGLGFDHEDSERIFRLFTKAHDPKRCGPGVGLAICRRLVEGVGGRIWAKSKPGEGACFSFTLPAGKLQDAAA